MLKISKAQHDDLMIQEGNDFIESLSNEIEKKYPDLISNKPHLNQRMSAAYKYLNEKGFDNIKLIRAYLHLTAFNEDFHNAPAIKKALEKPDHIPQQQFQDFLLITKNVIYRKGD